MTATRRIVVALSGASGATYGIRALEALRADPSVEIHAIVSKGARATIEYETDRSVADVLALAHVQYEENDLAAALASGTFLTAGMLVAPCSIRTMSAIAHSMNDNLIVRAADVHLKERRRLVMVVRETPLHAGHLRLMTLATESGAIVLPPVPGFYTKPQTVADIVDHTVGKVLDSLGIDHDLFPRWDGTTAQQVR